MKFKHGFGLLSLLIMLALTLTISCQHEDNPLPPGPYEVAELGNGGIMYDKFWAEESGFDQTDANFDLYDNNANFFRCKQCHAWDGLGTEGSYINRAPSATRPNVANLNLYELVKNKSAEDLYDAMMRTENRRDVSFDLSTYDPSTNAADGDKMPNYSQILTSAQAWDLVKFMKEGMFDVSQLYVASYNGLYPTGTATYGSLGKDGDAEKGNAYYSGKCASCHGADGTSIDLDGKGVGGFTRSKPYEVQHKTKYGQLGTSMVGEFDVTLDEMKDMYKALSSTTNFPTNIPVAGDVFFANDVEPIFYTGDKCTYCHSPSGSASWFDLSKGTAYTSIISRNLVDLGNPSASVIYTKPQSHYANYTNADAATVLAWIEQGAKDD